MKLSNTLALLFSASLLTLTACGSSTIGGGGGGGNGGGNGGGMCDGAPSPLSCTDTSCPDGYTCVADADPSTCHPSNCSCDPQGWVCTADCGMGGSTCVKDGGVDCSGDVLWNNGCTADADCVTKLHQIDCCGTMKAIGLNKSESAAFDALEAQCAATSPACGCASQVTTAEDGHSLPGWSSDFPVACKAGQCMTYSPAATLCNGVPSPESCNDKSCPDGFTCTPDPDPTTCHPSGCACDVNGWTCTADCGQNGSTCMKGL